MESNISWRFEEFWRIISIQYIYIYILFGGRGVHYSRDPATRIVIRRKANEGGGAGGG